MSRGREHRIQSAFSEVRAAISSGDHQKAIDALNDLEESIKQQEEDNPFIIGSIGRVKKRIYLSEIIKICIIERCVLIYANDGRIYTSNNTIKEIENQHPSALVRASRSLIVPIENIRQLICEADGSHSLKIKWDEEQILISRRCVPLIKEAMGRKPG
jgi:DNA-binding LytR/AlgR family response regulator